MKIHLIVDFMYLYYKYKFTIDSNRIRRLTADIPCVQPDGTTQLVKTDVSYLYYPLKEIEGFRKTFEKEGHDVTMSICFDAISMRKADNVEYKSNRTKKLGETDFSRISKIMELLDKAGHNIYKLTKKYGLYSNVPISNIQAIVIQSSVYEDLNKIGLLNKYEGIPINTVEHIINPIDMWAIGNSGQIAVIGEVQPDLTNFIVDIIDTPYGYEADDIIANLIHNYGNDFDFNIIYTPDTDLLVHINNKVGINRYKPGKGYTAVGVNNFSAYCSEEFKCNIPYNGLLLYKILCGDKSDVIKGKKGFGPKSFDKLVEYLNDKVDWTKMSIDYVENVVRQYSDYFGSDGIEQILESLKLVKHYIIPPTELGYPYKKSTVALRSEAYLPMGMKSLIE